MAVTLTAQYRLWDLPWSPSAEVEQRFRRILRNALIAFLVSAIAVTFLPVREPSRLSAPAVPDRVVSLVLRQQTPPPPPPSLPQPEAVPDVVPEPVVTPQTPPPPPRPRPAAQPATPTERAAAREQAQRSGLLQMQDQLAALRDPSLVDRAAQDRQLSGRVDAQARSERSLLTSSVGTGSGGINTAELSRGYGGGAGELSSHDTSQVSSSVLQAQAQDNVRRAAGSNRASRSEEEIALVFDRNKGAIDALYSRALRTNPSLQGKVVLRLTIAADGSVAHCEIVSSELNDPELERRLVARVRSFRFEVKEVGSITVTKPIDFFPA